MLAGDKVVFAVRAINTAVTGEGQPAVTNAKISVTKVAPSDLPAGEITLAKDSQGEVQWYKFKAATNESYVFIADVTAGNADVYMGTSLSSMHRLNCETYDVTAGNTVYFKVVNAGAAEAKLTLTAMGVKSFAEEIPETAFEIENGKSKIYKYTAKSEGRYVVNFESDPAGAVTVKQIAYDADAGYYKELNTLVNGQELIGMAGETFYFGVTENTTEGNKASVRLSVNPVKAAALEGELTAKVKPGEKQWFVYTVPATGRYIFAATAATGESKEQDYSASVKYFNKMTSEFYSSSMAGVTETWKKKGTVMYFMVPNDTDAEITVKLTAKEIEAEEITAGTKEVSLKQNEAQWLKFTASENTYYSIINELADEMSVFGYYYLNAGTGNNSFRSGNVTNISLDKGDTILIKLERYDSAEAESLTTKLTIRKEELLKLEEGKDLTITTTNNGRQYISFTPSRSAYYAFGVKEVPKDVKVTNSGDVYTLGNYYCVKEFEIAEEVRFYVGAQFTAETEDATKSYKLYVERINPTELEVGKAADVTVAKYQKAWFTFEAPEDGVYSFTTDNTAQDMKYVQCYNEGSFDSYSSEYSMPAEYLLSKGDKVTIAVSYKGNKDGSEAPDSVSFKVQAQKLTPQAIQDDKATIELEAGASAWLSYTAVKGCQYDIQCTGGGRAQFYGAKSIEGSYVLTKDGTVYIKVTNYNSEKSSVTVELICKEFETLSTDKPAMVELTAENISAGEYSKWLAFTAPTAGTYAFYSTSVESASSSDHDSFGVLYNSAMNQVNQDDDSGEGWNFKMDHTLKAGETVYLKVRARTYGSAITCNVYVDKIS